VPEVGGLEKNLTSGSGSRCLAISKVVLRATSQILGKLLDSDSEEC